MLLRLIQYARARSSSTLLAIAFLGACSACSSPRTELRELELAAAASERLTREFGDAAAEATQRRDEYERQLVTWRRAGYIEACPTGAVDLAGWGVVSLEPFPVVLRLPPGYRILERRVRVAGRDTLHVELIGAPGEMRFMRSQYPADLHGSGDAKLMSHCDDMVSGAHVHFDSAVDSRNPYRKLVSASYQLPGGGWISVRASLRDVEAQGDALAALRSVQLR